MVKVITLEQPVSNLIAGSFWLDDNVVALVDTLINLTMGKFS